MSQLNEFNQNIAFLNLNDLEDFFGFEKNKRYLEVVLKDPKKIEIKKFKNLMKPNLITN